MRLVYNLADNHKRSNIDDPVDVELSDALNHNHMDILCGSLVNQKLTTSPTI